MSILSEAEARAILTRVVGLSKADECSATLSGGVRGNVRFARNDVSTSGVVTDTDLAVRVAFGRRVGTATINAFDDAALERVVRRAEDLARLAPENPEFMPAIDKQVYMATDTFGAGTAAITPEFRAKAAADAIGPCRAAKLETAGFLEDGQSFVALMNSKGLWGYQRATDLDFTCTVRTADGRGSGWVGRSLKDAGSFRAGADVQTAMRKASASAEAKALEPGKYTVILEPAASSGLLAYMLNDFDARSADEGRSFLSKKGGGNRLGEQMMDPRVNIYADPRHPELPVLPWDGEGLARGRVDLVRAGKIASLPYSRFWAQKQGKQATADIGNMVMDGGTKTTAQLIAGTQRGILVTRTWYIRSVDPQTVLLTGLTRDGTFYIENGEIKYPIKNFRFNESPIIMLNNIDELGRPVRVRSGEGDMLMMVPPMRLRDFTFTSLSDAV